MNTKELYEQIYSLRFEVKKAWIIVVALSIVVCVLALKPNQEDKLRHEVKLLNHQIAMRDRCLLTLVTKIRDEGKIQCRHR